MKTLVKSVIVSAALLGGAVAPALAQAPAKTVMVDGKGATVDSLLLRWRFEATWVIDNNRILLRDAHRDHYLLTINDGCEKLDMDRAFKIFPEMAGRIYSSLRYEVRDKAGPYCDISKIEQVNAEAAASLRAELAKQG
jgi:hypothetical protein